jgi:hypothetical protein
MRFVRMQPQRPTLVTTKGTYVNSKGKETHHPRGKWSTNAERPPTEIKFIGVDGEGMTVNGVHRYVLFGVGESQIEDTGGLRWSDVFEHLYDVHRVNGYSNTAYTGFFLGYDFSQIFRTLPEERARMLLTKQGRAARAHRQMKYGTLQNHGRPGMPPHPVEYDGWQFDMLGMKRLRIRPKVCDCEVPSCKCKDKPSWMYICDVGSFFQSSFLKVIDPKGWAEGTQIVTDEEWNLIKEGKEKRSTAILDDQMRMYNRLENVVLSRVMGTLNTGFHNIGINLSPAKWFGPGQAAQTWLKNEGVPNREEIGGIVPLRMAEAARASYFGGWFEIMMHGIVPGITHEYDINSAYPSIIAKLPCLLHGEYSFGEGLPPEKSDSITLVYADIVSPVVGYTWKHKEQHIGTMLHRERGQISRPMSTEGWFWWDELQSARRAGLIKALDNKDKKEFGQKIEKWIQYVPCDCPPPMANIANLYGKRLAVGKTSPLGKAAKLVYNSAYGKFAQSEGMNPLFGNAIYASRITAGCRMMILDAIATHPYGKADVAMVATDAVYFLHEHPTLPLSDELGEWEHEERTNLTLFKPGVYWDDKTRQRIADGENPNFKARGFKASDFIESLSRIDEEFKTWDKFTDEEIIKLNNSAQVLPGIFGKTKWHWPAVKFVPSFVMITAVQALQRNNWELAGHVQVGEDAKPIEQNSDPFTKRQKLRRENYKGRAIYRSLPLGVTFEPSEPYDKRFGMDDPWSDEAKAEWGETQEGRMMDILAWILNGD